MAPVFAAPGLRFGKCRHFHQPPQKPQPPSGALLTPPPPAAPPPAGSRKMAISDTAHQSAASAPDHPPSPVSYRNRTSSAALSAIGIAARSKNTDAGEQPSPHGRSGSAARPFPKKITLHNELPNFLVKGCHLRFIRRFSSGCFFVAVKQRGHAICNFFLPCVDLARVHPVPARQLGYSAFLPDCCHCHFRFKFCVVFLSDVRHL